MLTIKVTFPVEPAARKWEPLLGSLWADCRFFRQATAFAEERKYKADWAGALARGLLCLAKAGANQVELHEAAENAGRAELVRRGYASWAGSGRFA